MFDINTIINAALNAAVTTAITPLLERIAALEDQAIVTSNAVDTRITALENNPAQGVDTQAAPATTTDITRQIINALSDTEHPLFQRLSSFMDAVAEQAMDAHTSTYDHDSYDSAVSDLEDRDYVTSDSLEDAVRDAVNNLSFDISVS